jgi:hypothetical protein
MMQYELIETDEGMTVIEIPSGMMPEEAAKQQGGLVVDPGPFPSYEDAYEALLALKLDLEDEDEELD